METRSIKVFRFEELEEKIQDEIIYKYSEVNDYPWYSENKNVMKEFESIFPIHVTYYGLGIEFTTTFDKNVEVMRGIRLAKYIYNNFDTFLYKPKMFWKNSKSRKSKVFVDTCCVLTGYYLDDVILKPIYDFINKPDNSTTFEYLIGSCLNEWIKACTEDCDNWYSRENIIEIMRNNDYWFFADGRFYKEVYNANQD